MTNIDMDKLCKGCLTYELHVKNPEIHVCCQGYEKEYIKCPCVNCLIKMMCSEVCDKHKKDGRNSVMKNTATGVDMNELCEGCILYEEHLKGLDNYLTCLGYLRKDTECPCTDCLVKMICKFTCKEITERPWWGEYNASRRDPIEP